MKALKEKRIGLRSLWRRGLVILSLFALVFASCSSSSGGEEEVVVVQGKTPYKMDVLVQPTEACYQGLPLDFTGIKVAILYTDGSVAYLTAADASKFTTDPPWATGFYNETRLAAGTKGDPFMPLYNYRLYYSEAGKNLATTVTVKDVMPIYREQGSLLVESVKVPAAGPDSTQDPNINDWTGTFYISNGMQLTGLDTRKVTKMYVDDKPDFGGITVEADYRKRAKDGDFAGEYATLGVAKRKTIPLALDKVDWKVVPYYNNGNETGEGGVYVTLGRNTLNTNDALITGGNRDQNNEPHVVTPFPDSGWKLDYGVANISPIDEMWHVTKLELEKEPELDPFFYWQEDGSIDWYKRVRDTARLKVTYSNNGTKSFSIPEAVYQNTVWLNGGLNTNLDLYGDGTSSSSTSSVYGFDNGGMYTFHDDPYTGVPVIGPSEGLPGNQLATWKPFGMEGILLTARKQGVKDSNLYYTKITKPQITFYYRGVRCSLDKPVFTNFMRVDVEVLAGGEQITVDMSRRDNDFYGMSATEFAKLIKVSAVYQAVGTDLEQAFPLKFKADFVKDDDDAAAGGIDRLTPNTFLPNYNDDAWQYYYSMNFGLRALKDDVSWGVASQVKTNGTKAVKIYYANPSGEDVYKVLKTPAVTNINGRTRNASVTVLWTNVPGFED